MLGILCKRQWEDGVGWPLFKSGDARLHILHSACMCARGGGPGGTKRKGQKQGSERRRRGRSAVGEGARATSLPLQLCRGPARIWGFSKGVATEAWGGPQSAVSAPSLDCRMDRLPPRRRQVLLAVTHAPRARRPHRCYRPCEPAAARVGSGAPHRTPSHRPAAERAGPAQRQQACSVDLRAEDAAGLEDGSVLGAAVLPPGAFLGASARDRPRRALVLLCLRLRALPG